jgi:hypothetical protein
LPYSFFNLNAGWGGWLMPRPGCFTPGKEARYQLFRGLGGLQDRSERVRKVSPPPGFDPRTVQTVTSCSTDWAIPALQLYWVKSKNCNTCNYVVFT